MRIARSELLHRLGRRVSGGGIATRLCGSAIDLGPALSPSSVLPTFAWLRICVGRMGRLSVVWQ
jgi:hypothetical protein